MCLISQQINNITNTKIFCATNKDNTHQLNVISNEIDNISNGNAMIIPIPLPQTIKFYDLVNYQDFFSDCSGCFSNPIKSYSLNYRDIDKAENSQYYKTSDYTIYMAPTINHLKQFDGKIFKLSNELKQKLEIYYYQPYWGFLICQLKPGSCGYHPIAYSHQIIQNKIYLPTRQYINLPDPDDVNNWNLGLRLGQDGSTPITINKWDESNIDRSPMFSQSISKNSTPESMGWFGSKPNDKNKNKSNSNTKSNKSDESANLADLADWNHEIYLYNINPYTNKNLRTMDSSNSEWDSQSIPALSEINFQFGECKGFEKIKIKGSYSNMDLLF